MRGDKGSTWKKLFTDKNSGTPIVKFSSTYYRCSGIFALFYGDFVPSMPFWVIALNF